MSSFPSTADPKAPSTEVFLFPASYAQRRLWFLDQLAPGQTVYNIRGALKIFGPLDAAVLEQSICEIARRHESLRTHFVSVDGQPQQAIESEIQFHLPVMELMAGSEEEREAEVERQGRAEAQLPFDLGCGPLFRAKLLRLELQQHVLLVSMHHIVSDGWSVGIFIKELATLYGAFIAGRPSPLPELPVQYADYSEWQKEHLKGEVLERQLRYWKEQLSGLKPLELPADRGRPEYTSSRGATEQFLLASRDVLGELKRAGQRQGATLFMVLLAAYKILLYRYSGQLDVTVGVPIAGRTKAETEPLIGFFVNTLVLRTNLSGSPTFNDLLQRVKRITLDAFANQEVPFEKLVEVAQPDRDLTRSPLFQVSFVLQNLPQSLQLGEARMEVFAIDSGTAKFDVLLAAGEDEQGIQSWLEYNIDLFDRQTILTMLQRFRVLLKAVCDSPDDPIGQISLAEQRIEIGILPSPGVMPDRDLCRLIAGRAGSDPDTHAVVADQDVLTYGRLNQRANLLAQRLILQGVKPGECVGICTDRASDLVVGVVGILKMGGVFVPLDPTEPAHRLSCILKDAAIVTVVGKENFRERFQQHSVQLLSLESAGVQDERPGHQDIQAPEDLDRMACVLYRSGPGGHPEGIEFRYRSLCRSALGREMDVGASDRLAMIVDFSRELGCFEIFTALAAGSCVIALPSKQALAPRKLANVLQERGADKLLIEAASLRALAKAFPRALRKVRLLVCDELVTAGSHLQTELEADVFERTFGLFGWTEGGGGNLNRLGWMKDRVNDLMFLPVSDSPARFFVLDEGLKPVPQGIVGEIYVALADLAAGYHHQPERSARNFIPDPWNQGLRLYRTGDFARARLDGSIVCVGRRDGRGLIRGQRVEAREVEVALLEHPEVRDAAVVVREVAGVASAQTDAFVTAPEESRLDTHDLMRHVRERLPENFVPQSITLGAIARTPGGGPDRNALRRILEQRDRRQGEEPDYVAPSNAIEEQLAQIWAQTLNVEQIGVHDNFFRLGGHSLLATQVVARMSVAFSRQIPLRQLFQTPTIAQLGRFLEQQAGEAESQKTLPLVRRPHTGGVPLSYAQQRLWFIDQLAPGQAVYSIPATVRIQGPLDRAALEKTLREVVRRHESLRTRFVEVNGEPQQVIEENVHLDIPFIDLNHLPEQERELQAKQLVAREGKKPFDLTSGPLLRTSILRLGDDHLLLINMHHIISDAWSAAVMLREISTLYSAFSAGMPSPLADLPIQYADFSLWQQEWLAGGTLEKQIGYWQTKLAALEAIELPTDHPRPAVITSRGAALRFDVASPALVAKLKELSHTQDATLYMTCLAVFQVLLHRYTGQEDIAVGSPIAGRTQAETEGLIGCFINTLVLRSDLSGEPTVLELLRRVKEVTLEAYSNQDAPFEKLVELLQPQRDLGRGPLFQVAFLFQNTPALELRLGSARLTLAPIDNGTTKFDLSLAMEESASGLTGSMTYNTDLFEAGTIQRMIEHYRMLLHAFPENTELPIRRLPLLTSGERRQLLVEWNRTEEEYPHDKCLPDLIEDQANRTPESWAVVSSEGRLTYAQLNGQANQVARYLKKLGVGPESRVGLCLDRNISLIVGMLGILKAGGAYVPLDPNYPAARLAFMLEDAEASVLLTQEAWVKQFPSYRGAVVRLERDWDSIREQSTAKLHPGTIPGNLAYLIYTSGSTGKPKGVAICHHSAVVFVTWAKQVFSSEALAGVLASTSICFDLSIFEIFVPLSSGGTVFVAGNALDVAAMTEAENLKLINTVPSAMRELVRMQGVPQSVRTVNLAGEPLPAALVREIYAVSAVERVFNLYGPSEDTTYSTFALVERGSENPTVPIGRPVANAQAFVLDKWMEPVPLGVSGELYMGGEGLARGYFQRSELTAERFVPNPFGREGTRLYRTGDLVRYRTDGHLEFLRRADYQVKIRGFRIELGEIESALQETGQVEQAVVVVREDEPGDRRLIAYVVPCSQLASNELRDSLKLRVPEYMIPSVFVPMEKLPLTSNGKIDRKALPIPGKDRRETSYAAPGTPLEENLVQVWSELLKAEKIGIHDNFFEIGGHSLLAVRLRTTIRKLFNYDLSLVALFRNPTIFQLARLVGTREATHEPNSIVVPLQPAGACTPFFCVHPVGGQVFCYAHLARELGQNRPFYGLQSPPLDTEDNLASIEQMAELYIRSIRQVQPVGPYILGGWSMGGLIAWEMASQLRKAGDTVALLVLLDTYPPSKKRLGSNGQGNLSMLARFAGDVSRIIGKAPSVAPEQFLELSEPEQWVLVKDELVRSGVLGPDTAEAEMKNMTGIFTRNSEAMDNYILHPGEQPTVLLKASEAEAPERVGQEWAAWAGNDLRVQLVGGNHYSMLQRPMVSAVAKILSQYLDRTAQQAAAATQTVQ